MKEAKRPRIVVAQRRINKNTNRETSKDNNTACEHCSAGNKNKRLLEETKKSASLN